MKKVDFLTKTYLIENDFYIDISENYFDLYRDEYMN